MRNAGVAGTLAVAALLFAACGAEEAEPAPGPKPFSAQSEDGKITVSVTHELKISARGAHAELLWEQDLSATIDRCPYRKRLNHTVKSVAIKDGVVTIAQGGGKSYLKLNLADGRCASIYADPADILPPLPIPALPPAPAVPENPPAPPAEKDLEQTVMDLGSEDFETREAATNRLKLGGADALRVLEKALQEKRLENPELQDRVSGLRAHLRAGGLAGTAAWQNAPVQGARVLLFKSFQDYQAFLPVGETRTDDRGAFSIGTLPPRAYFLSIDHSTGRRSCLQAWVDATVAPGKTTQLKDIKMSEASD